MPPTTDPVRTGGPDPAGGPDPFGESGADANLLELVLSTQTVEDHLQGVALAAAATSPSIAGCGITLRRERDAWTVASSDDLVMAVDEVQYGLGTGPCLESFTTGTVVSVADTLHEDRWGGYPAHALSHGVRSSLSFPLRSGDRTVGALNVYATEPTAFDDALGARLRAFASQAELAIAVALRRAEQDALVDQLRQAMQTRSVIDQALGILMARQRCTAAEAFAVLRSTSQSRNRRIAAIAADIVTATTGAPPQPGRFEH